MQVKENSLPLTAIHRTIMLMLIIVEWLLFGWAMLLFTNYGSIRIPFLNYPSIFTVNNPKTHYVKNVSLYILFWLQHILMATIKYKMSWFKQIEYFAAYDRYIFNITSGLTLWFIYSNLQPSYTQLFIIPNYICIPIAVIGSFLVAKSMIELGDKIMMPFKLGDILNSKYLVYYPYESKNMEGIKKDGIYSCMRHPLQSGLLMLMIFGSGVYTIEKVLHLVVMVSGIVIGVLMEEVRMEAQFKDYKGYREQVKARFIPYLHFLGL